MFGQEERRTLTITGDGMRWKAEDLKIGLKTQFSNDHTFSSTRSADSGREVIAVMQSAEFSNMTIVESIVDPFAAVRPPGVRFSNPRFILSPRY